jgi:RHS repeat-associated protein
VALVVRDGAGHEDTQRFAVGVPVPGDTTRPGITLTGPAADAAVTGPVEVTGSISDGALVGWRVEVCRPGTTVGCTLVGEGSSAVTAGRLATIDPRSLPTGTWTVRVTARDASGNTAEASVDVRVQNPEPLGLLRLFFEDLHVRSGGVDLTLTRVYDGFDLRDGELGFGWRYEWSLGRYEPPRNRLSRGWTQRFISGFPPRFVMDAAVAHLPSIVLSDGRQYRFEMSVDFAPGIPSSIPEVRPNFQVLDTSGARLRALRTDLTPYADDDYFLFYSRSDGGRLYTDPAFENEWEPRFLELTTPFGEAVVFDVQRGAVVRFREATSGVTVDLGVMASVRLRGADLVRFERDAAGRVTSATEVATGRRVGYTRDAAGDLTEVTTVTSDRQRFTYASGHRIASVDTPGDGVRRYEMDARGRVVRFTGPGGAVTTTTYDDARNRVSTTDALGRTVTRELDALGRAVRVTDGLGRATTITYDASGNEATRTDPLGRTTTFTYDTRGRRTRVRNPAGEVTTLAYNDTTGTVTNVTDGEGRSFRETVDGAGMVTAWTLPDGTVARRFAALGERGLSITDGMGRSSSLTWDERGRVTSQTDTMGRVTRSRYDDTAHTVRVEYPSGGATVATLDPLDRYTRVDFGGGETYSYEYTSGQPLPARVIQSDRGAMEFRRGPEGALAEVLTDGVSTLQRRYDAVGQLVSSRSERGVESYRYDAAGRLSRVTRDEGTLDIERDEAGQVTRLVPSPGRAIQLAYDAAGRVTAYDEGAGRRAEFLYDRSGRPTRLSTAAGERADFGYDANGRRNRVTLPGGVTWAWRYHPSAELDPDVAPVAEATLPSGVTFRYGYDPLDRLTSTTDASGAMVTLTRDGEGRVTAVRDARGGTWRMAFGPAGLDQLTTPAGRSQRWRRDAAGRVIAWTRADGTEVTYDVVGRVVRSRLPSGATLEQGFDAGARLSRGPGGAAREWLNGHGQVRQVEQDDGAVATIAYDAEGRMTEVVAVSPRGARFVTRYTWDPAGNLASVSAPDGGVTRYTWDARRRLTELARPNGVRTEFTFGDLPRPTAIRHLRGTTVVQEFRYTYDPGGRITQEATLAGRTEYGYDALGRLSTERRYRGDTLDETITRTWDAAGNLATVADGRGARTFRHDADDRIMDETGPEGVTRYTYNARGALTEVTAPAGTTRYAYDDLDRLSAVTLPDARRVEHLVDADGRRTGRREGTSLRRCLRLPATPQGLPDCALTYAMDGAEEPEAVVFGPLGPQSLHRTTTPRYLLGAANGTVAGATDAAGALVAAASYDGFGRRLSTTGEALPYGFTGALQDPATGLVDLRSRWYHPGLGRFLTPDAFGAVGRDPRTLHRYLYAAGDPQNHLDPYGTNFSLAGISVSINIQGILASIRTVAYRCLSRRLVQELFTGFGEWALGLVLRQFEQAVGRAIVGASPLSELVFLQGLADIFCNGGNGTTILPFSFFYQVDTCGNPISRGRAGASGYAGYLRCAATIAADIVRGNIPGIDIVFGDTIPIELKLGASTVDDTQLTTYCRFASEHGIHVALWVYWHLPGDAPQLEYAKTCFRCWHNPGSCPQRRWGSIYVGLGIRANSSGRHYYVPSPGSLCGG